MGMMRTLGLVFTVIPSGLDEGGEPEQDAGRLVERHAQKKARAVSLLYPESWVLSADTIVVLENKVFGKPANTNQAVAMLQELSGQVHQVLSGLCLMRQEPPFMRIQRVATEVRFKVLRDAEIRAYVKTGEPFDKAGAYGIQRLGAFLVESIRGSYTNVVGLPLCETLEWLLELGVIAPAHD
jgi:septum formation protein